MTYASERGFKVGKEYIVEKGAWKRKTVLFVEDDGTFWPKFQDVESGEYLFIDLDNFNTSEGNYYFDKTPNPKHILLKYIDEKYYEDDFLKYLISLV